MTRFPRRDFLRTSIAVTGATVLAPAPATLAADSVATEHATELLGTNGEQFKFRSILEVLNNPYAAVARGDKATADNFWNKDNWAKALQKDRDEGYNAIVYFVHPFLMEGWPDWFIHHKQFPEAQAYTADQIDAVIAQLKWIFRQAKELGLQNFLFSHFVYYPRPFAVAHGLDKLKDGQPDVCHFDRSTDHWGVRNELTRQFTEASIAELFQTYLDLDGLMGAMGEPLPGKRSAWYRDAIVPGLLKSGRKPIFIVFCWMMPLDDFMEDVVTPGIYENTWITVEHNGETLSDPQVYPIALRWPQRTKLPTIITLTDGGIGGDPITENPNYIPYDSPSYCHEMLQEWKKIPNCIGYYYQVSGKDDRVHLFRKALGHYGKTWEEYSDDPWLEILEKQFGNRTTARHMLAAYDAAFRINPEIVAIAWCPHDVASPYRLTLRYWHWSDDALHYNRDAPSPPRGDTLLSVRRYGEMVAKRGDRYRDNNGGDYQRPPYYQAMIWGHIDFPTTPITHMKNVKVLGQKCTDEANAALQSATSDREGAQIVANSMAAYKLLTDFYEDKVYAAIAAVIYFFTANPVDRKHAEESADRAVATYTTAINFIWENVDKQSGNLKSRWCAEWLTCPQLIEAEKKDRANIAQTFRWPNV